MSMYLKLQEIDSQILPEAKDTQDWFKIKFNNQAKVMQHYYFKIRQFTIKNAATSDP